jgi:putative protease
LSTVERKITLPLLANPTPAKEHETAATDWNGWTAVGALPPVSDEIDTPEPVEPQGAYNLQQPETPLAIPALERPTARHPVELLAPAGGPDAAFAAFHFGADAIYLGLKKFSARAEAENFTLEEVDEVTAYAHSLEPRRRVFVTINTLIRQDELPEMVEAIAALADIGVDALIIQDLGVYYMVRRYFPGLELHASTQLAVHNRAGAETLRRMGFQRVVLARELTFEEVRDITAEAALETEVFIHGALCYSYSGLCLFSAQTLGRSGNRGKCAYSCRDSFEVTGAPLELRDGQPVQRDPSQGFPFSMKDLALPDHLPALRAAGVSCFKIEGRKKSPLYVATTTDYYRKLIDGTLSADERPDVEAELQSVFSRPWTRLFVQSHKDKEVADRDTVGHRGTPVGRVEAVLTPGTSEVRLRFRTRRPLERHDGLQIDLPVLGKPYGFAVDHLWALTPGPRGKRSEVFEAAAGTLVEVGLPRDHAEIPVGAPVYCSSSQAVKQKYRHERPKPGLHRTRYLVAVEVELTADTVSAVGRIAGHAVEVQKSLPGPFSEARDLTAMETAANATFEKLGATRLALESFTFRNPAGRFIPVSRLNQLRRDLTTDLELAVEDHLKERTARVVAEVCPQVLAAPKTERFQWSIKVDRIGYLDAFEAEDLSNLDEIIVDVARDHPTLLRESLDTWARRIGRERIRLALPPITRAWEDKGIRHKVRQLREAGWTRWEAANLSAWSYLNQPAQAHGLRRWERQSSNDPSRSNDARNSAPPTDAVRGLEGNLSCEEAPLNLSTDWSVYVINRLAVEALTALSVGRFALSPEDGLANVRSLLAEFGSRAVLIVHQDTPLFVAESCAYANLIGGCPGKANCKFESMEMVSSHGERVTALDYHCRTIVLNRGPFCLSHRFKELAAAGAVNLRADFVYRRYEPREVRDRWRLVRAGRAVSLGHAANFDRGVL